jgi:hypothetical protein
MTTKHSTAVASYVAAERHLGEDRVGVAKTVRRMVAEIGTDPNTVRRWLRRDKRQLWLEYWPSANEPWEAQSALTIHAVAHGALRGRELEALRSGGSR